jgi:hypothetical protein
MVDDGTIDGAYFIGLHHRNDSFHFRPLKVIPLLSDNGYAITGYVTKVLEPLRPFPFVVTINSSFVPQTFKRFKMNGVFCDIDELSGGDFVFTGTKCNGLNDTSIGRKGLIVRTSSTFAPSYMREINLFSPGAGLHQFFDIMNDLILIDDDTAIVCGNVTAQCGILPNKTQSRTLLAKVNLSNGSFVWQKSHFNALKLATRLAIKSDEIVVAINGGSGPPLLAFYDRGGNFLNARSISFGSSTINYYDDNHNPQTSASKPLNACIQNIYYRSDDKVFLSGKMLHFEYATSNFSDIPFSLVYDNSNFSLSDKLLYVTLHEFPSFVNFLSYKNQSFVNSCIGASSIYCPFITSPNTIERISGTDEFVTMTYDKGDITYPSPPFYKFKELGFTNDNSMCGNMTINPSNSSISNESHSNVTNTNVTVPIVVTFIVDKDVYTWYDFDCQQKP